MKSLVKSSAEHVKFVRIDVQLRIYALAPDFKERREKNLRLLDIW